MTSLFLTISSWMRPYLYQIALALVITLTVIYSTSINRSIRKQIRGLHFLLRTLIFVSVCTFGYSAVIIFATPQISKMLASLDKVLLGPVIIGIFVLLGVLGQRTRQM